jgi:VanZ family protein
MRSVLQKYAATILLLLLVLGLCLMPTPNMVELPMTDFDKLVHALMFLGVSGVVFFDNTNHLKKQIRTRRIIWGSFVFPLLFGGFIELIQALTAFRTGDWRDFLFDGIGAVCGALICWMINKR